MGTTTQCERPLQPHEREEDKEPSEEASSASVPTSAPGTTAKISHHRRRMQRQPVSAAEEQFGVEMGQGEGHEETEEEEYVQKLRFVRVSLFSLSLWLIVS